MEVKIAVLADAANVSQEGKLNITGIFDRITAADFPTVWPSMVLVIRLEAHPTEAGKHDLKVVVSDEDGRKIAEMGATFSIAKSKFAGMPTHAQIIIPIGGAKFPGPGIYSFDIQVDGRYEDSTRLMLAKRGR